MTSCSTTLAVSLTHEALGGLIGARRPTVTLAIGELTESGAISRRDDGWLLLRRLQASAPEHPLVGADPHPLESGSFARAASEATAEPLG